MLRTGLLVFVLCLSACGKETGAPKKKSEQKGLVLDTIDWTTSGRDDTGLTREAFRTATRKAFQKLISESPRSGSLTVSGEIEVNEDASLLILKARAVLPGLKEPLLAAIAAEGASGAREGGQRLVEKGLSDLASALSEQLAIVDSSPARWKQALLSPEPDIQILALRLIGENRVKNAVREVAALLSDPRLEVAEAAADALAMIDDKKSVPLIIESISKDDLRSEVRAIEVLGRIGGDEAEAYLEMTAVGHEVPEVRSLSIHMLHQIQSRKNN